ncbi:S41 family peptidase [Alkaliphilus sp. B6464]|uniref:S41 family peptidase n=1 Tax=Alkaliphilus sp. B6464 TaxID=2731219 RepID=UPI001BAA0E5F|nr:S41 family peptidase [Alkaliphilus sp. B6464]QUH21225.1 peptidase S41 [Alkaliphilus sp. B6464]
MKKTIYLILITTVVFLNLVACSSLESTTYIHNEERDKKWEEDINVFVKELPKRHVNLFFKTTEKKFYKDVEELKQRINLLTDEEIIVNLLGIIASIGDTYTNLYWEWKLVYPLELYWFEDDIYVINTTQENSDILYGEVVSINDINMEDIKKEIKSIISYDNEADLRIKIPEYILSPEILYGLGIIKDKSQVKFTFKTLDGELIDKTIVSRKTSDSFKFILSNDNNEVPLYLRNSDKYYWYEYLNQENLMYVKYNQCAEMAQQSFRNFTKEVISVIDENKVEKIIIDMRNNGGGNSRIIAPLMSEILKRDNLNTSDSLYIIVGRQSYSSAILNAMDFKKSSNGTFIGEPTAGKPNHYGEIRSFNFKNSPFAVVYSTKYFKLSNEDIESFIPDKVIEPTIESYINKVDPVFTYILNQ